MSLPSDAPRSASTSSSSPTCRRTRSPAPGPLATVCWWWSTSIPRRRLWLRYTRRLAERLRAPWTALYVETTRALRLTEPERDRIARLPAARRNARRGGGDACLRSPACARNHPLRRGEQFHASRHRQVGRSRLHEKLFGSVTAELVRSSGDIAVHVIAGADQEAIAPKTVATKDQPDRFDFWPYLSSTILCGVALAVAFLLDQFLDISNIALVSLDRRAGQRGNVRPSTGSLRLCSNHRFCSSRDLYMRSNMKLSMARPSSWSFSVLLPADNDKDKDNLTLLAEIAKRLRAPESQQTEGGAERG